MMYIGKIKPRKSRELDSLVILITMSALVFLAVLFNGKYSSKIDVNGVVVREDVSKIYSGDSGAIEDVFFKNGDYVNKGDVLFKITNSYSNYSNILDHSSLDKQIEKIKELIKDELRNYLKQIEIIRSDSEKKLDLIGVIYNEVKLLNTTIELLEEDLSIIKSKEDRISTLFNKKMISKDIYDSVILEKQSKNKEINLTSIEVSLRLKEELKLRLEVESNNLKLVELEKKHNREMENLSERLDSYKSKNSYYIRSPSYGYINYIDSYENKFVSKGEVIATVKDADDNKVYVKLFSDSESLGYVKSNSAVTLRIEAFPYEKYGVLKGNVIGVSPTKVLNSSGDKNFSIIVRINKDFGSIEEEWLLDGMKVIGTYSGTELSLVEWLFLPVIKGFERNPDYWG